MTDVYKNDLTTLAARIRPLVIGAVENASNVGAYYPTIVPVIANGAGLGYLPRAGVEMLDGATTTAGGAIFQVPAGWSGTLTASAIIEVGNSSAGTVRVQTNWHRAAVDGLIDSQVNGPTNTAFAASSNGKLISFFPTTITSAAAGDIVDLSFQRTGGHAGDTYTNQINIRAFLIDYG